MAWASFPRAIFPSGIRTKARRPARAAYAAAEAEVFPVEAQMTALAPPSTALLIATVIPRSLKEPVGFEPLVLQDRPRTRARVSLEAGRRG